MQLHQVQHAPTVVPRYVSPGSIDSALALLAEHGRRARAVAGGTDLIVELDRGAHAGADVLVDLSRIDGLDTIDVADGQVHLGALVTHSQVVESAACRELLLPLAQASSEIGSPQLRNRATVAGNVITASPANDTISALLALGADIQIASTSGRRSVPIADFISGFRTTVLTPDELVTGISVRALTGSQRGVFVKAGLRRAQAISVVHLTAIVTFDNPDDDQIVTDAVLTLGSVAATVVPVAGFSSLLAGRRLDDAAIADAVAAAVATATPIDDLRATAEYRTSLVATMVERALRTLAAGQQASQWAADAPLLRGPTASPADAPTTTTDASTDDTPTGVAIDVDAAATITATVNGNAVTAAGAAGVTLLDWLRDEAGMTGVKEGCAEGECGACTVHLDGAAVMSCLVPAGRAAGSQVVTVEGLADDDRLAPIQAAFVDNGAVQCGFCTPGLLMSCAKLLDQHPSPTLRQVQLGLAGNLCRCTGYRAIERAIEQVAGHPEGEPR
jgi:xanthine dehydrogenase iron-sulfur cluster and FAD-binding subunit A